MEGGGKGLARLVLTHLQTLGGGGRKAGCVHVCEVLLDVDSPADMGACM